MPSMCGAAGEAALCNTRNWIDNTEAVLELLVLFVRFVVQPLRLPSSPIYQRMRWLGQTDRRSKRRSRQSKRRFSVVRFSAALKIDRMGIRQPSTTWLAISPEPDLSSN